MADTGLIYPKCKDVLADKLETVGWALCIGAGTSFGVFPKWDDLVRSLVQKDKEVDNPDGLFNTLKATFSYEALIQAAQFRLGQEDDSEYITLIRDSLYEQWRNAVSEDSWRLSARALTAGAPSQLTHEEWIDYLRVIEDNFPKLTAMQVAGAVVAALAEDKEPATILSFNAEPLLYSLINALLVKKKRPKTKEQLRELRALDRVTQAISYRKAGRIPYVFCHGLLPIDGGRDPFNSSVSEDKLVFLEAEYLRLANASFAWQSSMFMSTALMRSLVFVGVSFADQNLRRWLAWNQANKLRELEKKDSKRPAYGHYWIRSVEGCSEAEQRWIEATVQHLGVRLVWIQNWSDVGRCLKLMLGIVA